MSHHRIISPLLGSILLLLCIITLFNTHHHHYFIFQPVSATTTAADAPKQHPDQVEISLTGQQQQQQQQVSSSSQSQQQQHHPDTLASATSPSATKPPTDTPLPSATKTLHHSHPRYLNPSLSIPLHAPASLIWSLISDLDSQGRFHEGIVRQFMMNVPLRGVSATRYTKTLDGSEVIDRVVSWHAPREYTVELLVQPQDYPFEVGSREILKVVPLKGADAEGASSSNSSNSNERPLLSKLTIEMQVLVKQGIHMGRVKEAMMRQFEALALSIEKYAIEVQEMMCQQQGQ